jgi:hypothetical protein
LHPVNPLPPHCWYLATEHPPDVGAGAADVALMDVCSVEACLVAEATGAGDPVTTEPPEPALASVPPAIRAGPGAV